MSDLISVVVPVYNIESYLGRSVGSVLAQTHPDLEVIAVDDGSLDASSAVLDRLCAQDKRVITVHHRNGGVTSARLAGVQAARGEWIGFVDGDDEIEPYMYERLLRNAQDYAADISHCGYQMVFPSRIDLYYGTGRLVIQDNHAGLKDLIEGKVVEPGLWNKLFHKSLFHSLLHNNLMDASIRNTEDLLMNFYLFREANTSVFEDVCPYHYMVRKNSAATSAVSASKLRDPLRVLQIIRSECASDTELREITEGRIAGILVNLSTMGLQRHTELIRPYRASARRKLRKMLPELLRGNYSVRTKALSAWAAVWPWSYSAVHSVYSRLRGTDRKYEVS